MPAATAAEFPGGVHGSGSTTVTSQDGFVATVRWDWSDLVRIPTDDVPLVVPECADRVRIGLTGSSATDGAAYVLRIRSSVAYPEIAGFTWPANLTLGLAMESLYDPGFNADHGQPVCGTIGTQTPDVVTLTGPPGGDTTTFIAWVVGRTPKNPDAILTPGDVQVGLAESVDRTQLTGTELTVAGAFATCDPSCHFDLDVPLPR